MDNRRNLLDYETIKGAVHSEREAAGWKCENLCGRGFETEDSIEAAGGDTKFSVGGNGEGSERGNGGSLKHTHPGFFPNPQSTKRSGRSRKISVRLQ